MEISGRESCAKQSLKKIHIDVWTRKKFALVSSCVCSEKFRPLKVLHKNFWKKGDSDKCFTV